MIIAKCMLKKKSDFEAIAHIITGTNGGKQVCVKLQLWIMRVNAELCGDKPVN
jgi:hypothetical protein